ncbi:YncE family protein, partial [Pseudomonas sp. Marseille-Q1929]|nr:YncE family protein [Pseudomonas sp. Marseille-Q1929]
MEHISATGGNIVYTDPQLAGPPGGPRPITPDILAPFNGKGDTQIYYTVNDGAPGLHGAGGVLKTRKSAVLTVQVGPRIADMPKPELQGRIGNNVNPSHVVGNPLLTLPYTGTLDRDRIHWTIIGSALGGSDSGVININPATAGQALKFNVDRKILDLNLNGSLRILYSLERDGPPKVILRSEVLDLTVGAGVFLGRPVIVGASLSPDELNPLAALAGATVLARINPTLATDRIYFDWFSADGIGSTTLDAPGNAATHETSVTFLPRTIAKCIREGGSTIDVQYRFNRGSFPYHSEIVRLRLLPLTGLPTPKIDGIDGPILNLGLLDPNARTRVSAWHFRHENQRMWMRYTGTKGGLTWTEDTYTANLVTEDGVTNGIRPPTPVDKLKLLDDGSALTIEFWVSLAESSDKTTAILFGVANLIVQALPSVLPHPFINGASGTGPNVTVAPQTIEHNTTVTVKYDGMSGKDRITLKWMYADGTHYETALNGVAGGQVVFNLTNAKVLHRSVNSTVQLQYSVKSEGVTDPIPSEVQTVKVSAIPAASLAGPRINGLASGSTLDLNAFTGDGQASLAKWALSNSDQRAWITCSSAGVTPLDVLGAGGALITSTEAANGLVNKAVLRSWLTALANNAQITVTA